MYLTGLEDALTCLRHPSLAALLDKQVDTYSLTRASLAILAVVGPRRKLQAAIRVVSTAVTMTAVLRPTSRTRTQVNQKGTNIEIDAMTILNCPDNYLVPVEGGITCPLIGGEGWESAKITLKGGSMPLQVFSFLILAPIHHELDPPVIVFAN